MSFWDTLFKSDKDKFMEDQDRRSKYLLGEIGSMKGSNEGVNTLEDTENKFGIKRFNTAGYQKKVGDIFAPRRQSLGNALARNRSAAAKRMTGREAVPEFNFSQSEGDYYDALGNLESSQAGAELEGLDKEMSQNNWLANFFQNVLSGKDSFNQWKKGLQMSGENSRLAIGDQMDDSSLFNDITGIASTIGKFLPMGPDMMKSFGIGETPTPAAIKSPLTRGLDTDIERIMRKSRKF